VRPFSESLDNGYGYYLITHPDALSDTAVALFRSWLIERFGTTHLSALVARVQEAGGIYLPPLDDADMPGIYNACDIFAMPTRELEMFGMAAVEAQACGKPVIASDHGGLRETVPESAGARFQTGDAADLAAHLETLLDSPALLATLGAGARENAARYDWPRIAQRCQEVYAAL